MKPQLISFVCKWWLASAAVSADPVVVVGRQADGFHAALGGGQAGARKQMLFVVGFAPGGGGSKTDRYVFGGMLYFCSGKVFERWIRRRE